MAIFETPINHPLPQDLGTFGFQAEVKQLLQLMIHSLYCNRDIFLCASCPQAGPGAALNLWNH